MKKQLFLIVFLTLTSVLNAQNFSPAYFGPNANPVWEFTDATIPPKTTITLAEDFFFGFGDRTISTKPTIEVPLLPECVSLKVWVTLLEYFELTEEVAKKRSIVGKDLSGFANGDFYVQTRIRIFKEKEKMPSVILNSTLKTASGTNQDQGRYFDTPGYYFDAELGKSIHTKSKLVSEIRGVANIGFLCWETVYTQNDAPMFGGKIILSNKHIDFENALSGYSGWMGNGGSDPLIYRSKLSLKTSRLNYHLMYQYGIRDFPYHHIQGGISIELQKLTPRYNF